MLSKRHKRMIMAGILGFCFTLTLYVKMQPSETEKIRFVEVVIAKSEIKSGTKIADKHLSKMKVWEENASMYVQTSDEIIGKYAKDKIYTGEPILTENIKKTEIKAMDPSVREVRLNTNILASSGVGAGDIVDIMYVGEASEVGTIGKLVLSRCEVKQVLNRYGKDLETLKETDYNQEDMLPAFVIFWIKQEESLELYTLQGTAGDVVFRLAKYTDASKESVQQVDLKTKEEIIYGKNTEEGAGGDAANAQEDGIIKIGGER